MKHISKHIGIFTIWLALLACRPVFAIGWTELLILLIMIVFLLGPFLLRVYRAFNKIKKAGQNEEKED